MPYEIRYHPTLRQVLARLDAATHRRILEAIDTLKENPYRGKNCRELTLADGDCALATIAFGTTSPRRRRSFSALDTGEKSTDNSPLQRMCHGGGAARPKQSLD